MVARLWPKAPEKGRAPPSFSSFPGEFHEGGGFVSHVLIVEDEAHIATGLQFNLQAEGHTVQIAGDGETALDLLLAKHQQFDALVLDIMLPGKNGFTVANE